MEARICMKQLTVFLIIIGLFICIAPVSAWQIKSDRYTGTVQFYENGTGTLSADGYAPIGFHWQKIGDNKYESWYWFWSVRFRVDGNRIVSDEYPDIYLEH